ncbi:CHAT domain-containing tetratricopeptide repeat protein [Azonexus sp. R2A61]|uniref:CHAT domain-containing protein n=1 Tax=Azonexus sp. R2A61 TaxID=2744443 RepID=UPI001F1A27C1|nr:CHAT domain-containing tetratricopeptide repeat protein [Azonexus sp. R2A61]
MNAKRWILPWVLLSLALCNPSVAAPDDDEGGEDASVSLLRDETAVLQRVLPDPASPLVRCAFLHRRAAALSRLGRGEEAQAELREAFAATRPPDRTDDGWCERWRMHSLQVKIYRQIGDPLARVAFLQQIGPEWRATNPRRYFFTLIWLMYDHVDLGMLSSAEETMKQAEALLPSLRQLGSWRSEAENIQNQWTLAQAYYQMLNGNYAEAERLRRASLAHAIAYRESLERGRAREDEQLRRVARSNIVSARWLLASALSAQGRFAEAEGLVRESLRELGELQAADSPEMARVSLVLIRIKREQGQFGEAERLARQALGDIEKGQVRASSPLLADLRAELGFTLQLLGRWEESVLLFEARERGLRSNAAQAARVGTLRTDWAYALVRTGRNDAAIDMMQRIVGYYRRQPYADPMLVARARGYLAVALAAAHRDGEALPLFREALPELQRLSAGDGDDEAWGAGRQFRLSNILESYLALLARMHVRQETIDGTGAAAEAFRVADILRRSTVQRAVQASVARASLPDPELAELARREQDFGQRRAALVRLLARLASTGKGEGRIFSDLQRDIGRLEESQAGLRRTLSSRFPDYLNLIDPQPPTLAQVQEEIAGDEAVVVIYCAHDQSYVWIVRRTVASFRVVPVDAARVAREVSRLRGGLDLSGGRLPRFDAAAALAQYRWWLAPDEALWKDATVLDVVPHGALGQLPFGLLPTSDSKAAKRDDWLIERIALTQQASVSSFLALRRQVRLAPGQQAFAGFGDPAFGNPPSASGGVRSLRLMTLPAGRPPVNEEPFVRLAQLPDTERELKEIARVLGAPEQALFLGAQASERNAKTLRLADYRILAFATHGLVPGEVAGLDQPALALANPRLADDRANDGLLTLDEVLGLRLNAEWVLLSACNTGAADGAQGEALSGLGRGFFFAGARSLLVSNWAVETVSARLLTTGVFRQQVEHPEISRAEALRRSMRELMRSEGGKYAHPAYWAPFVLVGDGRG